jgi:hypothetical protein
MYRRSVAIATCLLNAACATTDEAHRLDHATIMRADSSALPAALYQFTASPQATAATNQLHGRLIVDDSAQSNRFRIVRDELGLVAKGPPGIDEIPPFGIEFITDGDYLVPVEQGPIITGHEWWDLVMTPGRVWDEPGDEGYSRAAIPFALKERGEDCIHNGLMTFLFKANGEMSSIAFQISSQTCRYLQFEMDGWLAARFEPGLVEEGEAVAAAAAANRASRLRVRPFAALADEYPGADSANFGSTGEIDPTDMTAFGFIIDGEHFASDCRTPLGPYPYCDEMALPSYSTAKSLVAGLGLMLMERDYPGTAQAQIVDYVPECDDTWRGVTIEHAVDMTTGHFELETMHGDEDAAIGSAFFLATTHAGKIDYACNAYPRKAAPGEHLAYHSWDTYLAGTAMNARLKSIEGPGADFYRDLLVQKIWQPLGLSALSHATRRTYDDVGQPYSGYGVTFVRDDVARLLAFLGPEDGRIRGDDVLDRALFDVLKRPTPEDPGMAAELESIRYNNGFRSFDVSSYLGCDEAVWVVTLSGFGGINFVVMPNGTAYYYFSDGNVHRYLAAVRESHAIRPMCPAFTNSVQ